MSKFRRARFWLDITDIWPQSLIDLGHLSAGSLIARFFGALERFSLRRAEVVTSVLPNIAEYVRDHGLPNKRTLWTPNGIDKARLTTFVKPAKNGSPFFTAMYAGGFAPAHALEVIVEAAAIIQDNEQTRVRFVLIGDGPEASVVRAKISTLGLNNVALAGAIPKQELYNL
jgi:glycosyltransferase involved in cell wall biosynthesis